MDYFELFLDYVWKKREIQLEDDINFFEMFLDNIRYMFIKDEEDDEEKSHLTLD